MISLNYLKFLFSQARSSVILLYFSDVVKSKELMKRVFFSFIPTALIGFILYKFIKNILFESRFLMLGIFAAVAAVFLLVEKLVKYEKIKLKKNIKNLDYKQAIIIGLVQSLAIIPGVSRAGAVITGMMILGYKRKDSAYFSFLLSVPTVFAAAFYDLYKMRSVIVNYSNNFLLLTVGFISAFISSYFIVKWFIDFLQKNTLVVFAYYRLVLVIIILLIFLLPL